MLQNSNIIVNLSSPEVYFGLPFHDLVLLIVDHEEDTRRKIIIYLCIKPEFLIDWEIRLFNVVKGHLRFKKAPSIGIDVHDKWLAVIINIKAYRISEIWCWPLTRSIRLTCFVSLIHYDVRCSVWTYAQIFGSLYSHFKHANWASLDCTMGFLCLG